MTADSPSRRLLRQRWLSHRIEYMRARLDFGDAKPVPQYSDPANGFGWLDIDPEYVARDMRNLRRLQATQQGRRR